MFPALSQKVPPHSLAKRLESVERLVGELGSTAHPGFRDRAQPFRPMTRCVNWRAGAGHAPTRVQRLQPIHHPREVLAERPIAARQLLQRAQAVLSRVDRREPILAQEFGQLWRIYPVALVARFQPSVRARMAYRDRGDVRLEPILPPGRPGPSSKVTRRLPRRPRINCTRMDSLTTLPAAFVTATAIASLCTSMPMYLVLSLAGCSVL